MPPTIGGRSKLPRAARWHAASGPRRAASPAPDRAVRQRRSWQAQHEDRNQLAPSARASVRRRLAKAVMTSSAKISAARTSGSPRFSKASTGKLGTAIIVGFGADSGHRCQSSQPATTRRVRVCPRSSIPGRASQIPVARRRKALSFDHFLYPMLTIKPGHD